MTTAVQKQYPFRYWTVLAFVVSIPNFLHFDPTGRTHEYGLFNLASLSDIGVTVCAAAVLLLLTILEREPFFLRKINFAGPLWVVLLANMALASLLEPTPKITPTNSFTVLLSFFRLAQWVIGFLLLGSLYTRATAEDAPKMLTQLIVRSCWINIAIIWVMFFFAPSLAYVSEDAVDATSTPRLGGLSIHPGVVALLAGTALLHSLMFLRGWRRVAACLFAFVTLALTYTRSSQISFFIAFMVYLLFLSPGRIGRWIGSSILLLGASIAVLFRNLLTAYITRGQQTKDVESLSGRSDIWEVSFRAFLQRPFLGYGFISGPRDVLRDNWTETHWIPPTAHNEFMQALLSGGILTAVLVFWVYAYVFWIGWKTAKYSPERCLFFLLWIQLTIVSLISTNLTTAYSRMGSLFVAAFFILYADRSEATLPVRAFLGRNFARRSMLSYQLPAENLAQVRHEGAVSILQQGSRRT